MNPNRVSRSLIALLVGAFATTLTACNSIPPPEASLEGVWELTNTENPSESRFFITLDDSGRVTRTETVTGDTTFVPSSVSGSADLDGLNVTLRTGSTIFEGTFDANFTVATGRQLTETDVPFVGTFITDEGDATLTRVE